MPAAHSRVLVVDASIMHGAGGAGAVFPTSKHCRDALRTIRSVCHRVLLTPLVRAEWDKHQSSFAVEWRASMTDLRKTLPSAALVNLEPVW